MQNTGGLQGDRGVWAQSTRCPWAAQGQGGAPSTCHLRPRSTSRGVRHAHGPVAPEWLPRILPSCAPGHPPELPPTLQLEPRQGHWSRGEAVGVATRGDVAGAPPFLQRRRKGEALVQPLVGRKGRGPGWGTWGRPRLRRAGSWVEDPALVLIRTQLHPDCAPPGPGFQELEIQRCIRPGGPHARTSSQALGHWGREVLGKDGPSGRAEKGAGRWAAGPGGENGLEGRPRGWGVESGVGVSGRPLPLTPGTAGQGRT